MPSEAQRTYQLIIDAGGSKAGADLFKRAADQISEASAKAAAAGKPLTDNVAATEKAYARLVTRIDPITTAQTRMAQEIAVVQRAFAAQKITVDQAAVNLQQIATRYDVAVDRAKKFGQGLGGASSSGKGFGTAIQQAGFQVGDFAVQIASGQGVLRPFIQQGTQLISMFGPWGAVIGAAGATVGALATSMFHLGDSTEAAVERQRELNAQLQAADDLMEKLNGKAEASREALLSQRQAMVTYKQAALDTAQSALDRIPQFTDVQDVGLVQTEEWSKQALVVQDLTRDLANLKAELGFFTGGHGDRLSLSHDLDAILASRTDLFGGEGLKEAETNAQRVARVLNGLQKQIDDFSKAPIDVRVGDMFQSANAKPGANDTAEAERRLKTFEDLKAAEAASKQFRQEIDQLIEQGTRGVEQRQKWEQTSLATQADQIDLLKLQIGLADESDSVQQQKLAHLRAEQEVHQQLGTTMDANALKYIENADAITKMSQQLQKQKAIAQELPQFFDQAFDRIGSAITQAMATGEIAMTNLLDVGRGIVSELIQEFIKLAALNPLKNWINGNDALPTASSLLGGLFGGGAATNSAGFRMSGAGPGASSMGGGFFSSIFSGIGSFFGFDQGGIMGPNGPVPLRKYAGGGVANSPQMAMFGEGSRPEAYVPLADGRSIPVTMQGGSGAGGGTVINVNSNVTISGRNGTPQQDADFANEIEAGIKRATEEAVDRRLAYHMRSGNMLRPGMGS